MPSLAKECEPLCENNELCIMGPMESMPHCIHLKHLKKRYATNVSSYIYLAKLIYNNFLKVPLLIWYQSIDYISDSEFSRDGDFTDFSAFADFLG